MTIRGQPPTGLIRRAMGPMINFFGRIAGIAVTIILVRYTGMGADVVPVLLALAVFAFAQAALAGPIELQAIAEVGRRPMLSPIRLMTAAGLLGTVVGVVLIAAIVMLSGLHGIPESAAGYFWPLGLCLPLTACFGVAQGIDIAHGRWMRSGIASFSRTLVVIGVVSLLISRVGLAIVPMAFFAAELVRLCMVLLGRGWLRERPAVEWSYARQVTQQVPSSMISSMTPTLDRFVVAAMGLGSIAILDLAEKANGFLNLSVTQGVIPVLYRRWALNTDPKRRRIELLRATRLLLGLCGAAAAAAAVVLPPVVAAVAGVSSSEVRASLDVTLWLFLAGFPGYVASQALVRLMILENLQKWFNLTAVIQLALNLILDVALGVQFGVPGVAAATALVWWLGLALCYGIVRRTPVPTTMPAAAGRAA